MGSWKTSRKDDAVTSSGNMVWESITDKMAWDDDHRVDRARSDKRRRFGSKVAIPRCTSWAIPRKDVAIAKGVVGRR